MLTPEYLYDLLESSIIMAQKLAQQAEAIATRAEVNAGSDPAKLADAAQATLAATEANAVVVHLLSNLRAVREGAEEDMPECPGCPNCKPSVN